MQARQERARTQRILLIDAQCKEKFIEYSVLGTRGTPYRVVQRKEDWSCECPDASLRHQRCKHIFFVDDRVLHNCTYAEGREQVKKREIAHELWASPQQCVEQRPWEDEECGICTELMTRDEPVQWCRQVCGQSIHQSCWQRWCKARGKASCPFCRAQQ